MYRLALCFAVITISILGGAQTSIQVDLRDAPRNIYHAQLTIPVQPGPLTLVYPEWIPGNHRPSGPIPNLMGLKMEANGQPVTWDRDLVDSYAFHLTVPPSTKELKVSLDTITTTGVAGGNGAAASTNVLDLNWNTVVLYRQGANTDDVQFKGSVILPDGWHFGTALPIGADSGSNGTVSFDPISLTTLVDSPLIAGDHYRQIDVTPPGEPIKHVIDMVSESDEGLAMSPQDEAAYEKLVAETGALFGARHYSNYHFLLTLSDQVGGRGLEHHQSSDNGLEERTFSDSDLHLLGTGLLPHEFTHSWNGKYRRPIGLATKNYQEPMKGDLLWVYEGLTEYLGNVLAVRSGLRTSEQYREDLAATAADLDYRRGREWRSVEDTARSVQIIRQGGPGWTSWRRSLDYYPESELIWLEVDTTIRQQSHGQKSLDDFCHAFYGGQSGPPKVVPYTFDDVVNTLNQVVPYDWVKLLKDRIYAVTTHAPMEGIERGGWRLVYNDQPNVFIRAFDKIDKGVDAVYSVGLRIGKEGKLADVIYGSPAYDAGMGPNMILIAVNGRKYSDDVLAAALKESKSSSQPIQFLVENADFYKTYSVNYHDGIRQPHLERVDGPDLIGEILKPLTK